MRIGLIAPVAAPVPPPGYGAIERLVHELAVGYQRAGHEVVLFATADSTCPVTKVATLTGPHPPEWHSAEVVHLTTAYAAAADAGLDLIHDHTVLGPLYGAGAGASVVTTAHWSLEGVVAEAYQRIARSVPVLAVSHAQAASAPAVPVARVIHPGIDPAAFPDGPGDGGYFLFLGRLAPEKGAREAVLSAKRANVALLVAGPVRQGRERTYFQERVAPLLDAERRYVGEARGSAKRALLGGARALLFPIAWDEPFGLVMIEAMACGTPVLAFRRGAVAEVIEPGVTGAVCADTEELAAAITEVSSLDRGACRAAVEVRFSRARMVSEHLDWYQQVLARRASIDHGNSTDGRSDPGRATRRTRPRR